MSGKGFLEPRQGNCREGLQPQVVTASQWGQEVSSQYYDLTFSPAFTSFAGASGGPNPKRGQTCLYGSASWAIRKEKKWNVEWKLQWGDRRFQHHSACQLFETYPEWSPFSPLPQTPPQPRGP